MTGFLSVFLVGKIKKIQKVAARRGRGMEGWRRMIMDEKTTLQNIIKGMEKEKELIIADIIALMEERDRLMKMIKKHVKTPYLIKHPKQNFTYARHSPGSRSIERSDPPPGCNKLFQMSRTSRRRARLLRDIHPFM